MATARLTRLLGQGALKALANLGGAKPLTWLVAFILLAVLNTVVDQISEAARGSLAGAGVLVPAGFLAGLLAVLYGLARRAARSLEPRAEVEDKPPAVRVLILFLSSPGELALDAPTAGSLGDPGLGDKLGRHPWRMPIAAVAHHISRLQRLIVVASSGNRGSYGRFADFKALVQGLLPQGKTLQIETSGEFLAAKGHVGVDFEDPQMLIEELGQIYRKLGAARVKEHDILIDVTGGTKVNTAAAVALTSLLPDRKFQYVSTNTYEVRSFDVTWDVESLVGAQ